MTRRTRLNSYIGAVDLRSRGSVTLTYASTVAIDATLGNSFNLTATGPFILGNPTGALDRQMFVVEIGQDAIGGRAITFGSKYIGGSDITLGGIVLSTAANATDVLAFRYNLAADRFRIMSFVRGY